MLQNKNQNQNGNRNGQQKRVKPADQKFIAMNTKKGKASNRQGIVYGAREAGRGSEHFEPGGRLGIDHTSGSKKVVKGGKQHTRTSRNEKRITSG